MNFNIGSQPMENILLSVPHAVWVETSGHHSKFAEPQLLISLTIGNSIVSVQSCSKIAMKGPDSFPAPNLESTSRGIVDFRDN